MNAIFKYSGVVALVIIAAIGVAKLLSVNNVKFGTAVDCQSVTCFTTVGVLTSLQDDGTAVFNGAVTLASTLATTGTFKVSSTGTAINRINTGTCYIQPYATTIAATSTAKVDCQGTAAVYDINTARDVALTGVTTGDYVQVRLATSTAGTTSLGLNITGASASTTPGYIELYIANMTGATYTWPTTGTATGTASYLVTK